MHKYSLTDVLIFTFMTGQGVEGSICDKDLGRVQIEVVLGPMLQLLALVSNNLAILFFERN